MESIVVFDSGLGGVTALMEAIRAMPSENFIYYGDTLHVPYGPKDAERIRAYLDEMMAYVDAFNPKAVLLACNTATVTSAKYLRAKYAIPIIGMEPAVKPAIEHDRSHKRVLVLSTEGTSRSERLLTLVDRFDDEHIVDILPLPNLVDFAERLEFDTDEVRADLEAIFSSFDMDEYSAVVLGCTHFIWYRDLFKKILPEHVELLDGNAATVRQLQRKLGERIVTEGAGSLKIHLTGPRDPRVLNFLRETVPMEFDELMSTEYGK
ncbi:MAG: glutamate racemase [Peptoniphilus sp.]|nr:glutamate racemase [Peptoniphilus sp.]MDD7362614.1 glutamate racemase [Bacillota bacterium]MDY6044987.1 glutamate racemase [Peptoniphilus sp.]